MYGNKKHLPTNWKYFSITLKYKKFMPVKIGISLIFISLNLRKDQHTVHKFRKIINNNCIWKLRCKIICMYIYFMQKLDKIDYNLKYYLQCYLIFIYEICVIFYYSIV